MCVVFEKENKSDMPQPQPVMDRCRLFFEWWVLKESQPSAPVYGLGDFKIRNCAAGDRN